MMPGHDYARTYMLNVHGLHAYYGHHEELASGLVLPLTLPESLRLEVAPASARNAHWRATMLAFKLYLQAEHEWNGSGKGRRSPGESTAAVILSAIGARATEALWTPYYPQAVTILRAKGAKNDTI